MRILCVISLLMFIPYLDAIGTILDASPDIYYGGQLLNYVKFNDSEVVKTCELEYRYKNGTSNKLLVNINSSSKINDQINFIDRLYNIGRGLCGVKIFNLTSYDPKSFSLIVSTPTTNKTYYNFSVSFNGNNKFLDETYYVSLGGSQAINCGVVSQISCKLYNPKGELVIYRKNCKYNVAYITIEDIGRWRCEIFVRDQMEVATENFDLKLKTDIFRVNTWYKEIDGLGMIGCKYIKDGYKNVPSYCTLVDPNLKYYNIKTGSLTYRYTTIGTNLTDFVCQIEMPLPLLESEKGMWKCKIHESGAYINVGNVTKPVEYSKRKEATLVYDKKLDIRCQVPYTTDNCYLRAPNGALYFSEGSLEMGICSKSFGKAPIYLAGTWTCHISNPQRSEDDIISVETYLISSVTPFKHNLEVTEGQSTELICNRSAPIRSCRFIDPQGFSYHLSSKKRDSFINYVGRGFEFGDCGINIKHVASNHDGNWTCLVQGVNTEEQQTEYSSIIKLTVYGGIIDQLSVGSSVGIPIGIGLACIVFFIFLIYVLYKKKIKKREENRRRPSQTSNGSGDSNEIINVSRPRRYDGEMSTFM